MDNSYPFKMSSISHHRLFTALCLNLENNNNFFSRFLSCLCSDKARIRREYSWSELWLSVSDRKQTRGTWALPTLHMHHFWTAQWWHLVTQIPTAADRLPNDLSNASGSQTLRLSSKSILFLSSVFAISNDYLHPVRTRTQTWPLLPHFCSISKHVLVLFIPYHYNKPLVIQNSLLARSYLKCLLKSIITSFNISLLAQSRAQVSI